MATAFLPQMHLPPRTVPPWQTTFCRLGAGFTREGGLVFGFALGSVRTACFFWQAKAALPIFTRLRLDPQRHFPLETRPPLQTISTLLGVGFVLAGRLGSGGLATAMH